jgi:murein DD-endopeptidase MepM/ murein hydrolase activator NlpD
MGAYCHNTRAHVAVGDQVAPGQHIADSGNTGRSGTPHLHVELRISGERLCPQPVLLQILEEAPPTTWTNSGCTLRSRTYVS